MAGRPKGQPKSGGRQKGTANKVTATTRERIEKEADPIGFLVNVVNGEPIEVASPADSSQTVTIYPNYEQRQAPSTALGFSGDIRSGCARPRGPLSTWRSDVHPP